MRNRVRTNSLLAVAAAFLVLTHSGNTGAVSATPEEYDPRLDPNYSRATSEAARMDWQAIWSLVREFEARAHPNRDRSQVPALYVQPQPWHYVQGAASLSGSPPLRDAPIYGSPYLGSWYAYGPSLSGWWGTSPRIPWWSLISPSPHNRHRHHGGQGHHHW